MKRLLTCTALLLAATVAIASNQDKPVPESPESGIQYKAVVELQARATESTTSRGKLLKQLRKKVELMSDQEVEESLGATEQEIRQLEAKAKLDAAASLLRQVQQEYDGTPSATVAQQMLAVHERGPGPVPVYTDAPTYIDPTN